MLKAATIMDRINEHREGYQNNEPISFQSALRAPGWV